MNEYMIMFCLFIAMVAVAGVIKILGVFRQVEIEKKRLLYYKLLKEARAIRMAYIKQLNTSDDFRIKLEGLHLELDSEKIRLNRVRATIREIIQEVRTRLAPSNIDKVEANVIVQKKITIGENWKVLDNFRRKYNKKLASFKLIENEARIHSSKTLASCEKWKAQKKVLMSLYDKLKGISKVDDPRSMLAASGH